MMQLHSGNTNKKRGLVGEYIASIFLMLKGCRLLARNFVMRGGEIDLVMRHGKTLLFVEVKRRKAKQDAMYAIHYNQQKRLIKAAQYYLKRYPQYQNYELRFDAVFLWHFGIKWIKNAWQT